MFACFGVDDYPAHETRISDRVGGPSGSGGTVLTKWPSDFMSVWPAVALDRSLFVLCLMRDPRDAVVSRHGKKPDAYWSSLRYWMWFRRVHDRLARQRRVLVIRYEDLVREPDRVQERIAGFLPFLEARHPFNAYHLHTRAGRDAVDALRGVRAISAAGVGAWRGHLERVRQQVRLHGSISDDLIRFGYEPDRSWERLLEGVADRDFDTELPEFFSRRERARRRRWARRALLNRVLSG